MIHHFLLKKWEAFMIQYIALACNDLWNNQWSGEGKNGNRSVAISPNNMTSSWERRARENKIDVLCGCEGW
jgi:hypothetical protein